MPAIYTSSSALKATTAKIGTKQAATRPLLLTGTDVVRFTLTDAELAAYTALDSDARAAMLAEHGRQTAIETGRIQITTAALAALRERFARTVATPGMTAREVALHAGTLFAGALAAGTIILPVTGGTDDTEGAIAALFTEETVGAFTVAPEPEPAPAKPAK